MKKVKNLLLGVLALKILIGSGIANEKEFFDQKDETFWVIKNKGAFIDAANTLIDENGNWKGTPPAPRYIKYSESLTEEDLPYLEKWLSLNSLTCFAIAERDVRPNLQLITDWYQNLQEQGVDIKEKNFYKLAWLNFKTMLNEVERGENSILPTEWVETSRDFQLKNSHYNIISTH